MAQAAREYSGKHQVAGEVSKVPSGAELDDLGLPLIEPAASVSVRSELLSSPTNTGSTGATLAGVVGAELLESRPPPPPQAVSIAARLMTPRRVVVLRKVWAV